MRLALIGPVLPYRGGIAQYTTELHRALASRCHLQTISFRRQYPAWLYPGQTDREPGQEDVWLSGVDYKLDAINPWTWISTARMSAASDFDFVLMDWWTLFWAPGFALIARILRRHKIPVLFICHNLADHDGGRMKKFLGFHLLSQADAFLVHSEEQAAKLRGLWPGKRILIHPHPTYDRFPPATTPPMRRGRLELLFFGFIRPYKGLDVLIEALARLNDKDIFLTIVGEPWGTVDQLRSTIDQAGIPNVDLHLHYVDDAAAADFFAQADLVVLPYRSATGSGVAALAYHYDCPVLATTVGGLCDVVEEGRTGFLVDPESSEQIADVLKAIDRTRLQNMREHVRRYKSRFTWDSLADGIVQFCAHHPSARTSLAGPCQH